MRDFDKFITSGLALTHTPGMSVAMVHGGVIFSKGYGYAEVETARRVTADTVFQIASVSKVVTATAMMMLWQDAAFKLDDAISPVLDFRVAHPKFPHIPITFRHLFTHTSGISDAMYDTLEFSKQTPQPLREFLADYLSPDGKRYDVNNCYSAAEPGAQWSYSNVAVALLGYLAMRVSPDPLDVLTQKRLFVPLGLKSTAWRYIGIPDERMAFPYEFKNAHYSRLAEQTYPDWPAGLLCTSANEFAKFLQIYVQGGMVHRRRFLQPATLDTILEPGPAIPDKHQPYLRQGLIWRLSMLEGRRLASHDGADPGSGTAVAVDLDRKAAALSFANIGPNRRFAGFQKEVIQRLLDKPAVS